MKTESTLTFIFGNCADILPRFLDCFGTLCDRMVAVRAIGNQDPDESWQICESRGCIMGEYLNREAGKKWPHVDDFGAARQMAVDIATGMFGAHWLVWADCDDVINPASVAEIQKAISIAAEDPNVIGLQIPYSVPEDGLKVYRERAWLSDKAKWRFPIHECLEFDQKPEYRMFTVDKALFLHAAKPDRRSHDERNLRILQSIPVETRTLGQRFHIFQSLRAVGRIDESVLEATALVQEPEIGTPEKYELLIALGQLTDDISARGQLFLQAMASDPSRREAPGELALVALGSGRPDDALSFTTIMRALPRPREMQWNARRKYYTWLGEQLHAMALRGVGRIFEADVVEVNHFRDHGAMISLVHATRGRPEKAWKARRDWLDRASDPDSVEHIFGLDSDDPTSRELRVCRHVMLDGTGGPVAAWNAAARMAGGRVIVQLSDDWIPPHGWDRMIIDALGDRIGTPAVLAVSDGYRTDDLLCMAIVTRERLHEQAGFLFHPGFWSMYSDNYHSYKAWKDGVVIDARDKITFIHAHPAFGYGEMDETYARSNHNKHYEQGEELFNNLTKVTE